MVYEGVRVTVRPELAGKVYGAPFGVDLAFGDILTAEPELLTLPNYLEFAGVESGTMMLYPRVAHIAEKRHAYTLPRDQPNLRAKDLPDIALFASLGRLKPRELRDAIAATFSFCASHPIPVSLPAPAECCPRALSKAVQRMSKTETRT